MNHLGTFKKMQIIGPFLKMSLICSLSRKPLLLGLVIFERRYYFIEKRGLILELIGPLFASWVSWAGVVFRNLISFMYKVEVVLSFGFKKKSM